MRRTIELVNLEGETTSALELSGVTSIKLPATGRQFIHLDRLGDGTWRMTYDDQTLPDIQELESLVMVRRP